MRVSSSSLMKAARSPRGTPTEDTQGEEITPKPDSGLGATDGQDWWELQCGECELDTEEWVGCCGDSCGCDGSSGMVAMMEGSLGTDMGDNGESATDCSSSERDHVEVRQQQRQQLQHQRALSYNIISDRSPNSAQIVLDPFGASAEAIADRGIAIPIEPNLPGEDGD